MTGNNNDKIGFKLLRGIVLLSLLSFFPTHITAQEQPENSGDSSDDPVVALVLAGGGALGFAHVGVIQVLEEEGIQPDIVVGTSIGSIVGGLYSIGYDGEALEKLVTETNWNDIFYDDVDRQYQSFGQKERQSRYYLSFPIDEDARISDLGISHAQHVVELLDRLFQSYPQELDFDSLPRRFRAVATDLINGQRVVFDQGDLKTSIRASMAVPGVFTPVEYQDKSLIDGGWVDNLPAQLAKDMGADIIITVPLVTLKTEEDQITSLTELGIQADHIRRNKQTMDNIALSDLVIQPDVTGFTMADFEKGAALLEKGYTAADSQREQIRQIVELQGDRLPPSKTNNSDPVVFINNVTVDSGGEPEKERELEYEILDDLDGPMRVSQLREYLYTFYDRGDYTHFWYHLAEEKSGGYSLIIDAPIVLSPEKSVSVSAGATVTAGDTLLSSLYLNGAYTRLFGKEQNQSLTLDFSLSEFSDVQLLYDFYPHSDSSRIRFQTYYFQNPRYFFQDDALESLYAFNEFGAKLSYKKALFKRMEISMGAFADYNYIDYRYGTRTFEQHSWFQVGARTMLAFDSLDRLIAPQEGLKAESYGEIATNDQEIPAVQAKVAADGYFSLGEQKWVGRVWTEGHGLISGHLNIMEYPSLGNSMVMYGYYPQEIRAENVLMSGFALRRCIAILPLALGDEVYLQAAVNGASSWDNAVADEYNNQEWYWGGSLGVLARTSLGEAEINVSANEEWRVLFQVSLKTSANLLKEM
ncbi:MAG: patatin-like phospholipase family protein [Spirochaetales bacterium]|nr:patatin-like phospholipase family protein [Spirochaetales bacterium]